MSKPTPTTEIPAGSLEDLSHVLAKLDVHDDQAHHEEGSIATFFKKLLSLGSKGEDINSMGAAAPVTMLEPLSQLEMVSRWNVDTFLKITNDKTDLERMKAVVAFALACLTVLCHDGKKPINPIITEVMTCAYVQDSADAKWSETAPVQFIGEQVSHHPPIPAFRLYSKENQVALDQVVDFKFSLGSKGIISSSLC